MGKKTTNLLVEKVAFFAIGVILHLKCRRKIDAEYSVDRNKMF